MIFIDTEFVEKTITTSEGSCQAVFLLSIALLNSQTGDKYYAVCDNVNKVVPGDFVKERVIPLLDHPSYEGFDCTPKTLEQIRQDIMTFVGKGQRKFAGYFCDYDWVALASVFGSMVKMPVGWGFYCYDIKQYFDDLGLEQPFFHDVVNKHPHCALCDVEHEYEMYKKAQEWEEVFWDEDDGVL